MSETSPPVDETIQPGTDISKALWERFRADVKERKGRVRGLLASELENAIENYLDASRGHDVEYRLDGIEEELERIANAVDENPEAVSSADEKNKKNSSDELGKVSATEDVDESRGEPDVGDEVQGGSAEPVIVNDGGTPVDDRHLTGELDEEEDKPVVERRTDGALEVLETRKDSTFRLEELDEAIRDGAGVASPPSIERYRDLVIERIASRSPVDDELEVEDVDRITMPGQSDRPLENRVLFLDLDKRDSIARDRLDEQRDEQRDEAIERERELLDKATVE